MIRHGSFKSPFTTSSWVWLSATPKQKLRSNGIMIGFPWSASGYVHVGSTCVLMPIKNCEKTSHVFLNENPDIPYSWALGRRFSKLGQLKKTMSAADGLVDCGLPKTKDGMSITMDWLGAESEYKCLAQCLSCLLSSLYFCENKHQNKRLHDWCLPVFLSSEKTKDWSICVQIQDPKTSCSCALLQKASITGKWIALSSSLVYS